MQRYTVARAVRRARHAVRRRRAGADGASETFSNAYDHRRKLAYGTVEADIARATTLTLGGFCNDEADPSSSWYGIPYNVNGSAMDIPRSFDTVPRWNYRDKKNVQLFADLEHWLDNGWKAKLSYLYFDSELDSFVNQYTRIGSSNNFRMAAIVGGRLDWYDDANLNTVNGRTQTYGVDREVTPYAALVYDLDVQHSVYASITRVFKPQSVTDRSGQLLPPVTGTNVEAGIKAEYLGGRLNASAAVFEIRQRNLAHSLDPSECNGPISCSEAAGEVRARLRSRGRRRRHAGLEPAGRLRLHRRGVHQERQRIDTGRRAVPHQHPAPPAARGQHLPLLGRAAGLACRRLGAGAEQDLAHLERQSAAPWRHGHRRPHGRLAGHAAAGPAPVGQQPVRQVLLPVLWRLRRAAQLAAVGAVQLLLTPDAVARRARQRGCAPPGGSGWMPSALSMSR